MSSPEELTLTKEQKQRWALRHLEIFTHSRCLEHAAKQNLPVPAVLPDPFPYRIIKRGGTYLTRFTPISSSYQPKESIARHKARIAQLEDYIRENGLTPPEPQESKPTPHDSGNNTPKTDGQEPADSSDIARDTSDNEDSSSDAGSTANHANSGDGSGGSAEIFLPMMPTSPNCNAILPNANA